MDDFESDPLGVVSVETPHEAKDPDGDRVFVYPAHEDSMLEEEFLGYKLWNLLVAVTILLFLVLMLNLCWSQCAKDDKDKGLYGEEEDCNRVVLAHQIQPGVMMVRGVHGQEIYTAVDDRKGLRMQMLSQQYQAAGYGSFAHGLPPQNTPTAPAPAPAQAPVQLHVQRPAQPPPNLLDLDPSGEGRTPPPYTPNL